MQTMDSPRPYLQSPSPTHPGHRAWGCSLAIRQVVHEEGQSAALTGWQECDFYFLSWASLCYFLLFIRKGTYRRMWQHRHILKNMLIPEITGEGLHPSTQHEKHHKHLLNPYDLPRPAPVVAQTPRHANSCGKRKLTAPVRGCH